MDISIRHIGGSMTKPSMIIEMAIDTGDTKIVEDITNLHGRVDDDFIDNLESIVEELRGQNKLLKEAEEK